MVQGISRLAVVIQIHAGLLSIYSAGILFFTKHAVGKMIVQHVMGRTHNRGKAAHNKLPTFTAGCCPGPRSYTSPTQQKPAIFAETMIWHRYR